MPRHNDPLFVQLAALLSELRKQYDFKIESYTAPEGGVMATFYPSGSFIGGYGNGKHEHSFTAAFVEAETQLYETTLLEAVQR